MKKLLALLFVILGLALSACDDDPVTGPSTQPTAEELMLLTTFSGINDSAEDSTKAKIPVKTRAMLTNDIDYSAPGIVVSGTWATDLQTTVYDIGITYTSYLYDDGDDSVTMTGSVGYKATVTSAGLLTVKYEINFSSHIYNSGTPRTLSALLDYTYTPTTSGFRITLKGEYTLDGAMKTVDLDWSL